MSLAEARITVLASGRGSNLRAISDAIDGGRLRARITKVISDNPAAPALEFARSRGMSVAAVPRERGLARSAHDTRLLDEVTAESPDLICLAGYMRLVSTSLVETFRWRILNVHPSLLPSFPGLRAQQQALDAGVRISGCTVHFVDEGLDSGPILVQRAVPILDSDDERSLSDRILAEEHVAYPEAISIAIENRWSVRGRRVRVEIPPDRGIAADALET